MPGGCPADGEVPLQNNWAAFFQVREQRPVLFVRATAPGTLTTICGLHWNVHSVPIALREFDHTSPRECSSKGLYLRLLKKVRNRIGVIILKRIQTNGSLKYKTVFEALTSQELCETFGCCLARYWVWTALQYLSFICTFVQKLFE